jgi:hypothetical protein
VSRHHLLATVLAISRANDDTRHLVIVVLRENAEHCAKQLFAHITCQEIMADICLVAVD